MVTSGTVSQTVFQTRKVIDHAFRRCKLVPEQISAEDIDTAIDCLYLLLSSLANRGIPLWCIEKEIVPLYQGQMFIALPVGTLDILNANYRTLTRLSGTETSSAGGVVDYAFDGDFYTTMTQTSVNGNVQTVFASATAVQTVGILPGVTAEWDLVFERSDDLGVTWTTAYDVGPYDYTNLQWAWFDIDGALASTWFRVRETGGGTLAFRELFLGNNSNEITLARLNQDQYTALPNKTFPGQPLQYWLNRQLNQPVMNIWPVTGSGQKFDQFVIWKQRYIQDVGSLTQEIDVPQRWYSAIVWMLARDVAQELPQVDDAKVANLRGQADSAWSEAQNEERDNSPITFAPAIAAYTRG